MNGIQLAEIWAEQVPDPPEAVGGKVKTWKDYYPLPWAVGPLGGRGGTSIIDADGAIVLEMGWLTEYQVDKDDLPILSDRQMEEWGESAKDPETYSDLISDGRWESRQVFELAGFIAAAINKAAEEE